MKKTLLLCAIFLIATNVAFSQAASTAPKILQMDLTWSSDTAINANFSVNGNFPLTVTFTVSRQSGAQEKLLDTSFSYAVEGYKQVYLRNIGTQDKDFHLFVTVSDTTGNYNIYGYDIVNSPFAAATGITPIQEKTIAVFPNPFKNTLNVTVQEEECVLHIMDMTGRKIHDAALRSGSNSINTEDIPAGIYIASLTDSKGLVRETKRISKE